MAKSKLSQAKHRIGSARITGYSRPIRNLKFRTSKGYSYGLKSKQRADFNRQNTTVDLPKHRLSTAVMGAKHRISGQVGDAIVNYTPDLYDTSQGNKDYATHTSAKLLGNGFMTARTGYRLTKSIKRRNWAKQREKYAQQGDIKKVAQIDRKLKYSTGFDLKSSTKRMMRNQSRKLMNEISSNEDNATATLGKGMKLSINAIKYRKQMVKNKNGVILSEHRSF